MPFRASERFSWFFIHNKKTPAVLGRTQNNGIEKKICIENYLSDEKKLPFEKKIIVFSRTIALKDSASKFS